VSHQRMRRAKGEEGVVLVEFSLVFALFIFILYALIAFGVAIALKQSVTHAAAEGARAAVGVKDNPNTSDDERETAAKNEVKSSLDWIGDKYCADDVKADVISCPDSILKTCMKVVITYPYDEKPIVPAAPGLGVVLPDELKSTAVVKLD